MIEPSRLLILDAHRAVGTALAAALSLEPDLTVVDVVANGEAAVVAMTRHEVDVLVVDPELPGGDAVQVVRRLRGMSGRLRVVAVTDAEDPRGAAEAVRAGVDSWVPKRSAGVDHLARVVRGARRHESWFPPALLGGVLAEFVRPHASPEVEKIARLTDREREILYYISAGMDRQAIAARLFLSHHTVRTHIQNLLGKLDAHTSLEAASIAVHAGLLGADPDVRREGKPEPKVNQPHRHPRDPRGAAA
ncbi:MAG: LuxR C-terminal-related transcriptional regulator [Frankia sp.]